MEHSVPEFRIVEVEDWDDIAPVALDGGSEAVDAADVGNVGK